MKILILMDVFHTMNGAERLSVQLAEGLNRRPGMRADIASMYTADMGGHREAMVQLRERGIETFHFLGLKVHPDPLSFVGAIFRLRRILREGDYDVVETYTVTPAIAASWATRGLKARLVGPMLATSTIIETAGGENLQIPRINTYSGATVASQAGTIGESDPAFSAFITMSAFKFSYITQVSREMIEDSGVDILGFLADQVGQGIGFNVNSKLTVGTGTVEPQGIVGASTLGITGATATSGLFTADNLIDLVYSVDGAARMLPGAGFMMNGASIGKTRKLKDTAGQYVFQPSLAVGTPDTLLGYPLYENPAIADAGTAAKSVLFGHLPSYYVRTVGGIRVDRSDDFAFSTDLVTLRVIYRLDGNLPQATHVNHFIGGAS